MVFRVEKNKNYTVMSNYHLRDKNLSLKAKGLLSWMLANTEDWDYSIAGIVSCCKESETAIKSTLKELQEYGYLRINKLMPESVTKEDGSVEVIRARIEYEYIIYEQPQENEIQPLENLCLESQQVESIRQINTKARNTNIINKNKEKVLSKDNTTKSNPSSSFDFGVKKDKAKKENLYSYCIGAINDFSDNEDIRSLLTQYLNLRLEMKADKPLYKNSWKGCLAKLKRDFNEDEWKEVIQQSIDRAYGSFFPVNNFKNKNKSVDNISDGIRYKNGAVEHYPDADHTLTDLVF